VLLSLISPHDLMWADCADAPTEVRELQRAYAYGLYVSELDKAERVAAGLDRRLCGEPALAMNLAREHRRALRVAARERPGIVTDGELATLVAETRAYDD
jgi:hypothetical protein